MSDPITVPPALVRGCNTPYSVGVLSDWIEEQTGYPLDLDQSGWDDVYKYNSNYTDGYGDGCGYGISYGSDNGDGDGFGWDYNRNYNGDGYGCEFNYNRNYISWITNDV